MDTATIAAIATPPGEGGIGVVRISGPDAADIAGRIFHRAGRNALDLRAVESHRLFGTVVDPATQQPVDEVLLAWMAGLTPTPARTRSSSPATAARCRCRRRCACLTAGARHAEPGEFTLRAFNGRLDLTQAEAVLNVIGARTAESLRLAVSDLAGDSPLPGAGQRRADQPARLLRRPADFPTTRSRPPISPPACAPPGGTEDVVAGSKAGDALPRRRRSRLSGDPTSAKAACSTRCCAPSAPSSPRSPARRAT